MVNRLVDMFSVVIVLSLFLFLVSFVAIDTQTKESKQVVTSFVDNIRYKGYITADDYNNLVSKIPFKNTQIQLTHIKADRDNVYKLNTSDMVFNSTIMGSAATPNTILSTTGAAGERGIYKLIAGDEFQVDVYTYDKSMYDSLVSAIAYHTNSTIKHIASDGGVVYNEKYK